MQTCFNLTGKTALVAGGGGYLGRAICAALAAHGAAVCVADLNEQAARAVAREIHQQGGQASAVMLDVSDESSIQAALNAAREAYDDVDVLVNCTTFATGKGLDALDRDDWQACLRVTLAGAFFLSRAAAGPMLARGRGSIIHFGSMYGMVSPDPRAYDDRVPINPPDYGAAKAGVQQLTRYQAVLWARQGVRVNAVIPGPFPNPTVQAKHPQFVERLNQRVPMGRVGNAEEIAGAVVYLASDAASYVTGSSLVVDGGWTAW